MPTRWIFNESIHNNLSYVFFGRSFGICDSPSNRSCVISDEYCHDNETGDGNATMPDCCRAYNSDYQNWSSMTWYYLHLRGVGSVSGIQLEFNSSELLNDTVPPCDNVSLTIEPFGTVPFHGKGELLRRIRNRNQDVRVDTSQISGTKLQFSFRTFIQ